ncbi:phenylalanine--tRNA ligase beta subunit-related protein [Paenibacillus sp. SC116]|uniref:B3/B4 domain-containing protein n=1 Tax=Paenibacillus sp. SC116 TaxID=2968986 RepID=UPI00215A6BEF|nr:phenylalanine--tRNA ligase beta subunit-related protein [Paenibacillus sp. SC116]MCR8845903.1 phenylalanine--tRNA ligase beta subunit-related protein [Paenibacillus sp. SC116]
MYSVIPMSERVQQHLNDVKVYGCLLELSPKQDDVLHELNLTEDWHHIHEQWRGMAKSTVGEQPRNAAYQQLYTQIGLNPKKTPPSVQNLLQRFFIKDELDKIPTIHPIVDAVNVAAIQHLIPLGVFDAQAVEGKLRLAFTEGGEPFQGLGESEAVALPADVLVLADDTKVLSRFCYRDGESQKVNANTAIIWLLGCQVPGIEEKDITESLDKAIQILGRGYRIERLDQVVD